MSQDQPRRPQDGGEAIKYGDVFPAVGSDLAGQPVMPRDAAMMQSAEDRSVGRTVPGGSAAAMQSAAMLNEQAGVVCHDDVSDKAGRQGVTVTQTSIPGGGRVVTEYVGEQIVGQYAIAPGVDTGGQGGVNSPVGLGGRDDGTKISMGEALEAAARTAGDKPVEQKDAAAIQAAEARATGANMNFPGGVAAAAQSAASANAWAIGDEDKYKLGDVLSNATAMMPGDKPVTRDDAERVVAAEARNDPGLSINPRGVAAAVTTAAQLNEGDDAGGSRRT